MGNRSHTAQQARIEEYVSVPIKPASIYVQTSSHLVELEQLTLHVTEHCVQLLNALLMLNGLSLGGSFL